MAAVDPYETADSDSDAEEGADQQRPAASLGHAKAGPGSSTAPTELLIVEARAASASAAVDPVQPSTDASDEEDSESDEEPLGGLASSLLAALQRQRQAHSQLHKPGRSGGELFAFNDRAFTRAVPSLGPYHHQDVFFRTAFCGRPDVHERLCALQNAMDQPQSCEHRDHWQGSQLACNRRKGLWQPAVATLQQREVGSTISLEHSQLPVDSFKPTISCVTCLGRSVPALAVTRNCTGWLRALRCWYLAEHQEILWQPETNLPGPVQAADVRVRSKVEAAVSKQVSMGDLRHHTKS